MKNKERKIIFRIHLQNAETGSVISKEFSFGEIFSGKAIEYITTELKQYFIIGKSEFTGRKDCKGNRIYENDIIEFDELNIHKVTWDDEYSEWSFGEGSASDMELQTVIGNKFDNPELWGKLS